MTLEELLKDNEQVIGEIKQAISRGDNIAVIGGENSGKSTLVETCKEYADSVGIPYTAVDEVASDADVCATIEDESSLIFTYDVASPAKLVESLRNSLLECEIASSEEESEVIVSSWLGIIVALEVKGNGQRIATAYKV